MAFRTNKAPDLQEKSASGAVATFNTALAMPLVECKVDVNAWQEGTGDPSPVNNRPIHGFSEVNLVNSRIVPVNKLIPITATQEGSGSPSPVNVRPIHAGLTITMDDDSVLEVYDGTLDVVSGELKIKRKAVAFTEDSSISVYYQVYIKSDATACYQNDSDIYPSNSAGNKTGGLSDRTTGSSGMVWANTGYVNRNAINYQNVYINIDNALLGITDYTQETPTTALAKFKTWLTNNPVTVLVPVDLTIQLSATELQRAKEALGIVTYTIQLGQEVYGAEVDVVNGVAHCTRGIVTLNGSENWYVFNNYNGYYTSLPTLKSGYSRGLCNRFPVILNYNNFGVLLGLNNSALYFSQITNNIENVETVAKWKTWVSNNNIQIEYPLATPFDLQLTPTQIETIAGKTNNIFADTGDVDLTYKDLDIAKRGNFREVFKIPENTKKLYGFKIDYENKTIDYLEDAVGMTPAYMDFTNNKFEYGSWENAFFMPRPCMLKRDGTVDFYLDPTNYDYRADGVTPSHVGHLGNYEASTTASKDYAVDDYIVYDSKLYQVTSAITTGDTLTEGTNISEVENAPDVEDNAMLEWGQGGQHIWYRQITNQDGTESVYISNYRVNDTFNAWSFYDANGMLKDHFYTPIYQGSIVNNVLRSISGMDYTRYCKSKTGAQEITLAEANNVGTDKGWYTEVNCDWVLTMHLLTLMSKSLNTSAKFGNGRCGQSSSETNMLTTGSMNDKGMFWGSNTNTYGVKVFGMENQWGNQWHRMAGLLLIDNQWYYKLTRYTNDGSTATDYNSTGTGYLTQTGHTAPTANYVQEMYFTDDGAFYDKVTGSSTSASVTMYQDYFYVNASGTRYALRGGHCYSSAVACGACFVNVLNDFGNASWSFGASVTYR